MLRRSERFAVAESRAPRDVSFGVISRLGSDFSKRPLYPWRRTAFSTQVTSAWWHDPDLSECPNSGRPQGQSRHRRRPFLLRHGPLQAVDLSGGGCSVSDGQGAIIARAGEGGGPVGRVGRVDIGVGEAAVAFVPPFGAVGCRRIGEGGGIERGTARA